MSTCTYKLQLSYEVGTIMLTVYNHVPLAPILRFIMRTRSGSQNNCFKVYGPGEEVTAYMHIAIYNCGGSTHYWSVATHHVAIYDL